MKEWLICLIAVLMAALFASAAKATPPTCYPGGTNSTNFEQTSAPSGALDFLAADPNEAAFVVTWYCDEKYKWKGYGWVGWKRDLLPNWTEIAAQLGLASKADKDAAWSQYLKCDFQTNPCPEYEALKPLMDRQFAATKPAAIIWQVRDNPTGTSRPVYPVNADGTRSTTALTNVRVSDVNTGCGCTAQAIEETGGVYCSVAGAPNAATADPADTIAAGVAICIRTN